MALKRIFYLTIFPELDKIRACAEKPQIPKPIPGTDPTGQQLATLASGAPLLLWGEFLSAGHNRAPVFFL
jgi:hypothetical protein